MSLSLNIFYQLLIKYHFYQTDAHVVQKRALHCLESFQLTMIIRYNLRMYYLFSYNFIIVAKKQSLNLFKKVSSRCLCIAPCHLHENTFCQSLIGLCPWPKIDLYKSPLFIPFCYMRAFTLPNILCKQALFITK